MSYIKDLHWRYNFNINDFEFVENNPNQHYEPLLKHVQRPTLVIDINLVKSEILEQYIRDVVSRAHENSIKFDQIIFDGTQDPVVDYAVKTTILDNLTYEYKIPCYFAVSQFDLTPHKNLVEINYPSWLFVFKKQKLPAFNQNERQFQYSCLNRNPTWHRLVLYTLIKRAGLLPDFVYSFYDQCPYQGHKIKFNSYQGLENLVGVLANECIENIQDFPISWKDEALGINDHTICHPAYQDSWCNVVTETSAVISFTSEKIWKPIAAGQLFLVAGAHGTCDWLKKLGFHTFSDHYDLKYHVASRFDCIVNVLKDHQGQAKDWWHENKFHIEHNYHWFHSGNVEKSILDPVLKQLNN